MATCRVVIEPEPRSGVHNMAVDEALLEAAIERAECAVRWYRWETATVSLGYFQDSASAAASPGLAVLPIVRRLTGGGAILHHHEWTYSCAVPPNHPLARTPGQIYDLVHGRIIAALAEQGARTALRGAPLQECRETFLCFGRGDPRDVVLNGHKIVGSAQRRRRGAVLQHGSLLLRRSEHAPQFPGLLDLTQAVTNENGFVQTASNLIGGLFGSIIVASALRSIIENRAAALEPRYRRLNWRQATGDASAGS